MQDGMHIHTATQLLLMGGVIQVPHMQLSNAPDANSNDMTYYYTRTKESQDGLPRG